MGVESTLDTALQTTQKAIAEVGKGDRNSVLKIAGYLVNIQEEVQQVAADYIERKKKWKKEAKTAHKHLLSTESDVRKLESEKKKRGRILRNIQSLGEGGADKKKLAKKFDELTKLQDEYERRAAVSKKVLSLITDKFGDPKTDLANWYL